MNVPPEHHLHHQRHGIHIDARHEDGREGEGDAGQRAGAFTVTQLQIAGNRVGFGETVEGHHYQPEEDHGREGSDPIEVRGENAVLISGCGPTDQFNGAQVGGEKTEARDPSGHLAGSHEEIVRGVCVAPEIDADTQHHHEINADDEQVGGGKGDEPVGRLTQKRGGGGEGQNHRTFLDNELELQALRDRRMR